MILGYMLIYSILYFYNLSLLWTIYLSPYVVKYYGSYFKNTDLWVSLNELVSLNRMLNVYIFVMKNSLD